MFKQFLENADGNQGYLISSLAIFLLFFILVGIYVFTMRKDDISYLSQLPLNDDNYERGS